jgi:ABC-type uncharacterized transport system permease subunit
MSSRNSSRSRLALVLYVVAVLGALNAIFAPIPVYGEEEWTLSAKLHDYISLFSPFLVMAALARAVQYLADIRWLLRQDKEGEHA